MTLNTRDLLADIVRAEYGSDPEAAPFAPSADVPVVVIDDVVAWLLAQEHEAKESMTMHAAHLFSGPLSMAPAMYQTFWTEATFPNPLDPTRPGYRTGELVVVDPIPDDDDAAEVRVIGWTLNQHGLQPPHLVLVYRQYPDGTVSAFETPSPEERTDGELIRWTMGFTPWTPMEMVDALQGKMVRQKEHDAISSMAVVHGLHVVAACAFAICKNIHPEPVHVPPRLARKRAKNLGLRAARDGYTCLRLPGWEQWRTKERLAAGAGAQELPGHLVRAHPKTYRRNPDGSGGLGRNHAEGTWLWRPQFRGADDGSQRLVRATVSPPRTLAAEPEEGTQ